MVSSLGNVRYCDRLGMTSIQKLIDKLAETGYSEHRRSNQFFCNYALDEFLFLGLYETMGPGPFREAWKDIYLLTQLKESPVSEEEIYQAFLRHTPADQTSSFKELYQRWHGGNFSYRVP